MINLFGETGDRNIETRDYASLVDGFRIHSKVLISEAARVMQISDAVQPGFDHL